MRPRELSANRRSEPHLRAVEFAQLGVAEEDAVYVLIHLFEPNLFVSEYFTDEHPAFMPTDVPAVVHPPSLERSRILEARYPAGEQPSAGNVDAPWRFVGQRFVRAFIVAH